MHSHTRPKNIKTFLHKSHCTASFGRCHKPPQGESTLGWAQTGWCSKLPPTLLTDAAGGAHVQVANILISGAGSGGFHRIANSVEVCEDEGVTGARASGWQRLDTHPACLQPHRLRQCHDRKVPVLEVAGVAISIDVIEVITACSTTSAGRLPGWVHNSCAGGMPLWIPHNMLAILCGSCNADQGMHTTCKGAGCMKALVWIVESTKRGKIQKGTLCGTSVTTSKQ